MSNESKASSEIHGAKLLSPTDGGRHIDSAIFSELHACRKVLTIQQEENYKCAEHIGVLQGEIDHMSRIIDAKQRENVRAIETIRTKDNKITELLERLKYCEIEKAALKSLEDQNIALYNRLAVTEERLHTAESDLSLHIEELARQQAVQLQRGASAVAIEAKLTADVSQLSGQLKQSRDTRILAEEVAAKEKDRVRKLESHLRVREDIMNDQLSQSRRGEYLSLNRASDLSNMLQKSKDDTLELRDAVNIATFRGNTLSDRLKESLEASEVSRRSLEKAVGELEGRCNTYRINERSLLNKKNSLAIEIEAYEKTLGLQNDKVRYLESVVEQCQASSKVILRDSQKFSSGVRNVSDDRSGRQSLRESLEADAEYTKSKHALIARLLRKYVDHQNDPAGSLTECIAEDRLDLSGCGLVDSDLTYAIEWLRLLDLKRFHKLDFKGNNLTEASVETLMVWISTLPDNEYSRKKTLDIDFKYNKIFLESMNGLAAMLNSVPRATVSLTSCVAPDDGVLMIYNAADSSNPCVKIDCRYRSANSGTVPKARGAHGSSAGTELTHIFIEKNSNSTVFPRNEIFEEVDGVFAKRD